MGRAHAASFEVAVQDRLGPDRVQVAHSVRNVARDGELCGLVENGRPVGEKEGTKRSAVGEFQKNSHACKNKASYHHASSLIAFPPNACNSPHGDDVSLEAP